jgi:hypothetical protein
VFLLAVSGVVMCAQNSATPSADVTIRIGEDRPEYCLGEIPSLPSFDFEGPKRGPDDITLRLPLTVRYENHRAETIIVPLVIQYLTRMTVAGQNGSTVLRTVQGPGMDVNKAMAVPSPDARSGFSIIPGGNYALSTGAEGVLIPVVDRSSGVDLRGKTVQIMMTRDFRSLTSEAVEKLNEKWKDYGRIWTGVTQSEAVTFRIPEEPLTKNCVSLVGR